MQHKLIIQIFTCQKSDCPKCAKFAITDVALAIIPKDRYPNWANKLQEYIHTNQTNGFVEITELKIKILFGF